MSYLNNLETLRVPLKRGISMPSRLGNQHGPRLFTENLTSRVKGYQLVLSLSNDKDDNVIRPHCDLLK